MVIDLPGSEVCNQLLDFDFAPQLSMTGPTVQFSDRSGARKLWMMEAAIFCWPRRVVRYVGVGDAYDIAVSFENTPDCPESRLLNTINYIYCINYSNISNVTFFDDSSAFFRLGTVSPY